MIFFSVYSLFILLVSTFTSESFITSRNHIVNNLKKPLHASIESSISNRERANLNHKLNLICTVMLPCFLSSKKALAVSGEEKFINALAVMIVAKNVILPSKKYVEIQAYDNARTDIQYILNQMQLQKNVEVLIQNSIDFMDDMDIIEAAQEAGNRLTNTAIQYDSSIYTCVFIPSEDGTVPPSAEKYRKQAYQYYESFIKDIDTILKVASDKYLLLAQKKADEDLKKLPPVLFKEVKIQEKATF